ncbi:hypothetical protein A3F03_00485 [Candidatus Roizmanbacteria bacterium RIFCSPHIGHO2_12_FULL_41_11]|uniref:DUF6922 domain-containing protein n=2 Tax=Candidatus Roizmaniibacteriota TaxID=1752723 RepID=A0A1F7J7U8_9BACT|nr:MAG: hypothetical protein A3F03_00485 [Candidatus Roizmanbacteria bacterium RIFCSPHIGHO2_12_FULL_41_11]OGK51682.1 MAG: hypothetical protein A2966_05090 [Candidatus Roizmanbacteria bacterium RIFCSPLOWO2_01_FULL_41_22]
MPNSLPLGFQKYFWDTDLKIINPKKNAVYVVERLLEWGDAKTIHWLENAYGRTYLKKIIIKTRRLSPKSANFYAHFYLINPKRILCLQKGFPQKQRTIWNRWVN